MKVLVIIVLSVLCLAEGNIISLTDENFKDITRGSKVVLVNFFAPWCSHCKVFKSEYEKLANLVKDKDYVIAEIDTTIHKNITKDALISIFPTIRLYHNGSTFTYMGERIAEDILTFINKKINPALVELNTNENVNRVREDKGRRCIFAVDDNTSISTYKAIAKRVNEFRFYVGKIELMKEVFGEIEVGNVVLLDEGEMKVYKGEMTSYDFEDFLEKSKVQLVPELNFKIVELVFVPNGKKGVFLFYDSPDENIIEELKKTEKELNSTEYLFAKVNIKGDWGLHIADSFGIHKVPTIEGIEFKDDIIRYKHTEAFNNRAIKAFIKNWKEGKLNRHLNSEVEPESNKGPVFKVVEKTFKSMVIDNDDDVLVMFTSKWCNQCQTLDPIFRNLSESLSKNEKLKFMEIDGMKNDIEGYKIQAFPMLKMFPGKNKTQVSTYDGGFREKDITKFVKAKSSHPVEIPEEAKDKPDDIEEYNENDDKEEDDKKEEKAKNEKEDNKDEDKDDKDDKEYEEYSYSDYEEENNEHKNEEKEAKSKEDL